MSAEKKQGAWRVLGSLYANFLEDLITDQVVDSAPGQWVQEDGTSLPYIHVRSYANVDRARTLGVDLQLSWMPSQGVLDITYSRLWMREILFQSAHQFRLSGLWDSWWSKMQWNSPQLKSRKPWEESPDYWMLDFHSRIQVNRRLAFTFRVDNEQSASQLDTANVNYSGPPFQRVYYDFSRDSIIHVPQDVWDVAIHASTAEVIANSGIYGSGVRLYATDSTDIDADYSAWEDSVNQIITAESNPLVAIFNTQGVGNGNVYLVRDGKGNFHKLTFQSFGPAGEWSAHLAHGLEGTASAVGGALSATMDYLYLDLDAEDVDATSKFPAKGQWDIVFTRALEFSMGPAGWGAKSAILLNTNASVKAALIDSLPIDSATYESTALSSSMDAIGASWYVSNYDPTTHISTVTVPDLTCVIQDASGDFYKLQVLTFTGPNGESFYSVFRTSEVES